MTLNGTTQAEKSVKTSATFIEQYRTTRVRPSPFAQSPISFVAKTRISSSIANPFIEAQALYTAMPLHPTFIIKQIITEILAKRTVFGTFLWQSTRKKVEHINVEFALCRFMTYTTGKTTTFTVVTKRPTPRTPNLQSYTNPVIVSVAVNPLNLVGRSCSGFSIS